MFTELLLEWGRGYVDVDNNDDADAAGSRGTERQRDARRRPVADDPLVVVHRPARKEDDRGDVGHMARVQRGEAGHQLVQGSRRERPGGRGLAAYYYVAALVVNYEFLEGRAEGQRGVPVEVEDVRSYPDREGLEVRQALR